MVRISSNYALAFSPRHLCSATIAVILLAWSVTAYALDFSVPYVRQGLSYFGTDGQMSSGVGGFGAIVGELEVRSVYGKSNGIDGYNGHRQGGLGSDTNLQYGFQDVVDFTGSNNPADNSYHGTYVAGIMASEYTQASNGVTTVPLRGMAPWARYYGAIFSGDETKDAYTSLNNSLKYLTIDKNVSTVNSSWGWGSAPPANGSSIYSLLLDEYAGYQGKSSGTAGKYLDKLMVIAVGDVPSKVLPPADSYNGLSVGALGAVNASSTDLFDTQRAPAPVVASYSASSPLPDGRSGVDVVAPGTALFSTIAINLNAGTINGTASGTSFSAPHVTGEAALLYGVASQQSTSSRGTTLSTDHKLLKALIINSADKIAGLDVNGSSQSSWQPGKVTTVNGVTNALVPLNYAVGAGSANANEAYRQYLETGNRFWDLKTLSATGASTGAGVHQYYSLVSSIPGQPYLASLTATLTWDRHLDFTYNSDPANVSNGVVVKDLLSDLNLVLQKEVDGVWQNVYMSAGSGDNLEHIYLPQLSGPENYRLDVYAASLAESNLGEQYALAVSFTAVPEPSTLVLLGIGSLGLSTLVWRKSRSRRALNCQI